jgi:hypothetical protein
MSSHSFTSQEGPHMCEPVAKEEWRQYFQAKLKAAEQSAGTARTRRESEHLQAEADQIRTKLRLLDFDVDAWRWACEHS